MTSTALNERVAVHVIGVGEANQIGAARISAASESVLNLVLLLRHADWADETPIAVAEERAAAIADRLMDALKAADGGLTDILEDESDRLADTYYSVLIATGSSMSMNMAAVGDVTVWEIRGGHIVEIVKPTSRRIGDFDVLESAFGMGFKASSVQTAHSHDSRIVVSILGNLSFGLGQVKGLTPHETLAAIREATGDLPKVVAVF